VDVTYLLYSWLSWKCAIFVKSLLWLIVCIIKLYKPFAVKVLVSTLIGDPDVISDLIADVNWTRWTVRRRCFDHHYRWLCKVARCQHNCQHGNTEQRKRSADRRRFETKPKTVESSTGQKDQWRRRGIGEDGAWRNSDPGKTGYDAEMLWSSRGSRHRHLGSEEEQDSEMTAVPGYEEKFRTTKIRVDNFLDAKAVSSRSWQYSWQWSEQ